MSQSSISQIRTKIHRLTSKESAAIHNARMNIRRKLVDRLWISQDTEEVIRLSSAIDVVEAM